MTNAEAIAHIVTNGMNGCIQCEEYGTEQVQIGMTEEVPAVMGTRQVLVTEAIPEHTDAEGNVILEVPAQYATEDYVVTPAVPPQPIYETHNFQYHSLSVNREDLTLKKRDAQATLAALL